MSNQPQEPFLPNGAMANAYRPRHGGSNSPTNRITNPPVEHEQNPLSAAETQVISGGSQLGYGKQSVTGAALPVDGYDPEAYQPADESQATGLMPVIQAELPQPVQNPAVAGDNYGGAVPQAASALGVNPETAPRTVALPVEEPAARTPVVTTPPSTIPPQMQPDSRPPISYDEQAEAAEYEREREAKRRFMRIVLIICAITVLMIGSLTTFAVWMFATETKPPELPTPTISTPSVTPQLPKPVKPEMPEREGREQPSEINQPPVPQKQPEKHKPQAPAPVPAPPEVNKPPVGNENNDGTGNKPDGNQPGKQDNPADGKDNAAVNP